MSSVNKPVIPAEVADAIEKARSHQWDNERIAYFVVNPDPTATGIAALRSIPFDTLLAALVNGYERELPEEERLAKAYQNIRDEYQVCLFDGSSEEISFANGMRYALDTLSIKIEGVNA